MFGLALAYGGIGQFAAGIWEFAKGNTFGATAFCSYGAFWVSFWWLTGHTDLSGVSAGDVANGVGMYLLAWGIFTAYMTVAATADQLRGAGRVRAAGHHLPDPGWGEFATSSFWTHLRWLPRASRRPWPRGTPRSPAVTTGHLQAHRAAGGSAGESELRGHRVVE